MRKTNFNLRRLKFLKRMIVFLLIQAIIISLFILIRHSHTPVENQDLKKAVVVVDNVEYEYKLIGDRMFSIYSDSKEYGFPKIPTINTSEYSMYQLYKTINIGDSLTIEYIEDGENNKIIGACLNNKTLRSVNGYNSFIKTEQVFGVLTFIIVEIVFVVILLLFLLFYRKELNSFFLMQKPKKLKSRESNKHNLSNILLLLAVFMLFACFLWWTLQSLMLYNRLVYVGASLAILILIISLPVYLHVILTKNIKTWQITAKKHRRRKEMRAAQARNKN